MRPLWTVASLALLLAVAAQLPFTAFAQHEDEHDEKHELEQKVRNLKGMSIAVIFSVSMIVDLLVIFLSPKLSPFVQRLAASFAGGVILVVGVCHVAGEASEILHGAYGDEDLIERFRPSNIVMVAGCLMMLLLQRGVHKDAGHSHAYSEEDRQEEEGNSGDEKDNIRQKRSSPQDSSHTPVEAMEDIDERQAETNSDSAVAVEADGEVDRSKKLSDHHHPHHVPSLTSRILLLSMFLVHSLIEGLALGLQSQSSGVILLFVSIVVHHWAEDFTFAFSHKRNPLWQRLVLSTIQAASCPIGIAIGWGAGANATPLVIGYLLAVSSGTFVFLALVEVVSEVMPPHERSTASFVAFFMGSGLSYLLLVLVYDPAAHAHGQE